MRDFRDVTQDEVKAIYEATPEVNQAMTWAEVVDYSPMYNILKMSAIDHASEREASTLEDQQAKNRATYGLATPRLTVVKASRAPEPTARKAPVVVLGKARLDKLVNALRLARNCLQCPDLNASLKEEAMRELSAVQQFLNHGAKK